MTETTRSNSPTTCGHCGGAAYTPQRMEGELGLDGLFNVCSDCGAECSGTGAYTEESRWYWTSATDAAKGREGLAAAQADAEWADERRFDY